VVVGVDEGSAEVLERKAGGGNTKRRAGI